MQDYSTTYLNMYTQLTRQTPQAIAARPWPDFIQLLHLFLAKFYLNCPQAFSQLLHLARTDDDAVTTGFASS
jgi:hypothetical protein